MPRIVNGNAVDGELILPVFVEERPRMAANQLFWRQRCYDGRRGRRRI